MTYPNRRAPVNGPPGEPGAPGAAGVNGKSVELERDTDSVNWRQTGDATWQDLIPLSLLKGNDGAPGVDGAEGPQGERGDKGDAGIAGATGATGSTGPQGEQGFQGLQGVQGPTGLTGATGSTGSQGAQGIQGIKGDKGDKGDVGSQGIQGATGATGATGANGISYSPQPPTARTVALGTAYQHTDTTKPFKAIVNVRATQSITLAGTIADKIELRVGATSSAVTTGTGASVVAVWESGITGIALMIGAGVQDGAQLLADLPAGWYFGVFRTQGTNASVVNAFTQSMTA